MVDIFTLALTHGLILVALWRLMLRDELDVEHPQAGLRRPWVKNAGQGEAEPGDA